MVALIQSNNWSYHNGVVLVGVRCPQSVVVVGGQVQVVHLCHYRRYEYEKREKGGGRRDSKAKLKPHFLLLALLWA